MSSNDPALQNQEIGANLPIVSDEASLRDAGGDVETTSEAPSGRRADGDRPEPVIDAGAGLSSLEAQGGPSDIPPEEIKTPASAIKSRRDFEGFLRASGFSRAASKAIASNGWTAIDELPEDSEPEPDAVLVAQLHELKALFD